MNTNTITIEVEGAEELLTVPTAHRRALLTQQVLQAVNSHGLGPWTPAVFYAAFAPQHEISAAWNVESPDPEGLYAFGCTAYNDLRAAGLTHQRVQIVGTQIGDALLKEFALPLNDLVELKLDFSGAPSAAGG